MNNIGKLCIQCGEKTTLGAWRCPARVAERLSHRVFDVSTLRAFVKDLDVAFDKPEPGCRHRAEDDAEVAMRTGQ